MKKIILITICFISLSLSAQVKQDTLLVYPSEMFTNIHNAGISINKFQSQATTGLFLETLGGLVIGASFMVSNEPDDKLMLAGAGITLIGFVYHFQSYLRLKEASIYLKRIKPSSSGVGVAIRL